MQSAHRRAPAGRAFYEAHHERLIALAQESGIHANV